MKIPTFVQLHINQCWKALLLLYRRLHKIKKGPRPKEREIFQLIFLQGLYWTYLITSMALGLNQLKWAPPVSHWCILTNKQQPWHLENVESHEWIIYSNSWTHGILNTRVRAHIHAHNAYSDKQPELLSHHRPFSHSTRPTFYFLHRALGFAWDKFKAKRPINEI